MPLNKEINQSKDNNFTKDISTKMNLIARLAFEFSYYNVAV